MEISIKEFKVSNKTTMPIDEKVLSIDHKKIGDMEFHFYKKPVIRGKLIKKKSHVLGEFEVEAFIKEQCSRCLKELNKSYVFNVSGLLVEEDFEDEEFESILIDSDKVKLVQVLELALIENISNKILCKEDCKGLCKSCGGNLNLDECTCNNDNLDIDPRLEKLKDILS